MTSTMRSDDAGSPAKRIAKPARATAAAGDGVTVAVGATRFDWVRIGVPISAGIVSLTIFALTLAPTVTAEDSGELIAGAWHFGVVHPPGYPLWTILCGLFTHLFAVGNVAWRANLFSALCSSAAAMCAYAALRSLGFSRVACWSSALCWILARWSWSQSVITEVYGLNSLLCAAMLAAVTRWQQCEDRRWLVWGMLILGLGMSNHHTIALAALALAAWVLSIQPRLLARPRLILACVGALVIGLLPYLYLPTRARQDPVINWGRPATLAGLMEHVSRRQYGALGPMKTIEPRSVARFGQQLVYLVRSVADDVTPALAGASCMGLAILTWRRWRVFLLAGLWLVGTGVLFCALANFDADRTSQWAMRVFLIPVPLGLMIGLAGLMDEGFVGAAWFGRMRSRVLRTIVLLLIATLPPGLVVAQHWRQCDYSEYWYAEDHARNLLACMLPSALVFPSGDHCGFPLIHAVHVEDERTDVLIADMYGYISPGLVSDRPPDAQDTPEAWLIKRARRPAYCATKRASPVANAHFVSAGLLYHLLPDGMRFDGQGLIERCSYRNQAIPTVVDHGAAHILADYAFFRGLAQLESGDSEAALQSFDEAVEYGWGIKELYNNIGSALAEHGQREAARPFFEEATRLDRYYVLPRRNLARMAMIEQRWAEAAGHLEALLATTPTDVRALNELGRLCQDQLDQPAKATGFFRRSLAIDPEQPAIRQLIAP